MEKGEIFKVDCKPRKVRVYRIDMEKEESVFIVYEGRKMVEKPNAFLSYYSALMRCMIAALGKSAYYRMIESEL